VRSLVEFHAAAAPLTVPCSGILQGVPEGSNVQYGMLEVTRNLPTQTSTSRGVLLKYELGCCNNPFGKFEEQRQAAATVGLDAHSSCPALDIDVKTDAVVNLEHEFESGAQVRHSLLCTHLEIIPLPIPHRFRTLMQSRPRSKAAFEHQTHIWLRPLYPPFVPSSPESLRVKLLPAREKLCLPQHHPRLAQIQTSDTRLLRS
jgi:hypothetical protein